MKRAASLLSVVLATALAGCQDAPVTAPASPQPSITNQAPVAVIRVTSRKPLPNGKVRVSFSGTSSYDPDGTITQYYWYPDYYCRPDPAYGSTFYMDVPVGDSCGLTLTVTDDQGATNSVWDYYSGF